MLAVAGGKGGCGKTTTSLGLALAAARRGRSVLAVDADVDVPDLHRVAGVAGTIDVHSRGEARREQPRGRSTLLNAERDGREGGQSRLGDEHRGLGGEHGGLESGHAGLEHQGRERVRGDHEAEPSRIDPRPLPDAPGVHVLPARPGADPDSLPDRIERTGRPYHRTIVDCPAGGGRDAAIPLREADRVVLVTTAGEPSLRDAAKTEAMARAVGTPVAGAVLTRSEGVPEGVDDLLGTTTVEAVPHVGSPLRDGRVTRRYVRILRRLSTV